MSVAFSGKSGEVEGDGWNLMATDKCYDYGWRSKRSGKYCELNHFAKCHICIACLWFSQLMVIICAAACLIGAAVVCLGLLLLTVILVANSKCNSVSTLIISPQPGAVLISSRAKKSL